MSKLFLVLIRNIKSSLFLIPFLLLISAGFILINLEINHLKNERYAATAHEMQEQTRTLIREKSDAIMLIALALAEDHQLQQALKEKNHTRLSLKAFSKRLRTLTALQYVWFQVHTAEGISFYRSWNDKRGDNMRHARLDVDAMIRQPHIKSSISVGKYDLSFKAMVPIFHDHQFIGIFEVIAKFNSIAEKLLQLGVQPLFLVDKRYKKQITQPFSRRFLGDYYVANLNADEKYFDYVRSLEIETDLMRTDYFDFYSPNNELVTHVSLLDLSGKSMAHLVLFKPIETIDMQDIMQTRREFIMVMIIFIFIIVLIFSTLYSKRRRSFILEHNVKLSSEVSVKTMELKEKSNFLQEVIDSVSDTIMVINKDYTVTLMNKAARNLYDKAYIKDVAAPKCYEISHSQSIPCNNVEHPCPLAEAFKLGISTTMLHEHQNAYVELTATPLRDNDGNITAILEIGHDVTSHMNTQQKLHEQKSDLKFMADHDALTGLPNRVLFLDRLKQTIKRAHRYQRKVGVMFIDLDRFKEVNDSFGHEAGDKLLQQVSQRLKEHLRETDTIARLGGDEFTIVIDDTSDYNHLADIAENIVTLLGEPITIEALELYVTASIGISLYPEDGDTPNLLLRNADAAMYRAKERGKNTYQFYTQDMTEQALERVLMERNLRYAIQRKEFEAYYQPQVDGRDGKIIGLEALVRWNHPTLGLVTPAQFISNAEETGLIVAIDRLMLTMTFTQMQAWIEHDLQPGKLSLNLSIKQLEQDDFIAFLKQSLNQTGFDPTRLELEVTEGQLMKDPKAVIAHLNEIKLLGVTIGIDDFGTGYSSLSYLKKLPIDKLKIDRSFIHGIPDDEEDIAITQAVIALAHSLQLDLIAEGVETVQQRDFLLEHGCNIIQGYLYFAPQPVNAMTKLLKGISQ